MIDGQLIDEIRQQVDIVDVIGSYVALVKKGQGYFAVCPFHDDSHPSMSVSPQKQIYKCFVCNNGGNVFVFVQNYLKISFIEAVIEVAKFTNIDMSTYQYKKHTPVVKESSVVLYQMYDNASKIYSHYLHTESGATAKQYTNKRQLNDDIIHHFGIGYALKTNTLLQPFQKKEYALMDMYRSGLIVEAQQNPHDRYYNRLMFPLHDHDGRVVGFSGRLLEDREGESKYINSSESEIFTKGSILYNYHRVKNSVKQSGFVYICEGFMDVIGMYKANVENVVSIMGTALTKEHCNALLRLSKKVVLCLDGDKAGKVATIKSGLILKEHGFLVEVVALPDGKDPDDIVSTQGVDELLAILDKKVQFDAFWLECLYDDTRVENYSSVKEYIQKAGQIISSMHDEFDKTYYIDLVAKRANVDISIVQNSIVSNVSNIEEPIINIDYQKTTNLVNKYVQAERNLLHYMFLDRNVATRYVKDVGFMFNDLYKVIASYVVAYYKNNMIMEIADFISGIQDEKLIQNIVLISELVLPPLTYDIENKSAIDDYIELIKQKTIELEIHDLSTQMMEVSDTNKQADLLKKIIELKEKRTL